MRLRHLLIAGVSALALTTAAQANPCPFNTFCIVDANGALVGQLFSTDAAFRQYNGTWYTIPVDVNGIQRGTASPLYTTKNCTGQAYLPTGPFIPLSAGFGLSGKLYTANLAAQTVITPMSFIARGTGGAGACYPEYNSYPIAAAPIMLLDSITPLTWKPPFSIAFGGTATAVRRP